MRQRWMVALALWLGGSASAMSTRTEEELLASSKDGRSRLVELRAHGPEGGGSLTYEVRTEGEARGFSVTLSSDFSPGDGSTPQRISKEACEAALERLAARLAAAKIDGITLTPRRCGDRDRSGAVTRARPR